MDCPESLALSWGLRITGRRLFLNEVILRRACVIASYRVSLSESRILWRRKEEKQWREVKVSQRDDMDVLVINRSVFTLESSRRSAFACIFVSGSRGR